MARSCTVVVVFALLTGLILAIGALPPRGQRVVASVQESPARRTVVLPNALALVATVESGAGRIAGAAGTARAWARDGLIGRVYPELGTLPIASPSGTAEPERLLQLRADAVVAAFNQRDQLQQVGLTRLAEMRFDSRRPVESRLEGWRRLGTALGDDVRTVELCRRFQSDLAAAARLRPAGTRPVRAVFLNMTGGHWSIAGSNYYGAYRIVAVGGANAAASLQTFDRANLEQLVLFDPDVILFTSNTSDQSIAREVLDEPSFRVLRAVRERRIYHFPEHAFMNELVEDRILLTWLAEVFYLDALPRRTRQIFKETYRELYAYELAEAEIDRALYMDINRGALGYERFAALEARP